jgi:hypothetical protein
MRLNKSGGALVTVAALVTAAVTLPAFSTPERLAPQKSNSEHVMLILRGIADSEHPRGQLDDQSALEYARRVGFQGEVLDVAGNTGADSPQVKMALERIRHDEAVTALYGFSGGGYNARVIWKELTPAQRERISKVVVIGSPGVTTADFDAKPDVLVRPDPPSGHLEGPKALLESLGPGASGE